MPRHGIPAFFHSVGSTAPIAGTADGRSRGESRTAVNARLRACQSHDPRIRQRPLPRYVLE